MGRKVDAYLLAQEIRKKAITKLGVLDLNKSADIVSKRIGKNIKLLNNDLSSIEKIRKQKLSACVINEKDNIKIVTDSNDSPSKQRFTVANELGNLLLNFDQKKIQNNDDLKIEYIQEIDDDSLQGVNEFASELLIPSKEMKKMAKNGYSTYSIANKFGYQFHQLIIKCLKLRMDFNSYGRKKYIRC